MANRCPRVLARTDHRFYTAMAIAIACTVLTGFGRTFYLKGFFHTPPLPLLLHIHGALCTSWVLLYVTQNILIMKRNVRMHRLLGWATTFLSLLVCIASVPVALYSVRRGHFAPAHDAYTSLLAFDFRNIFNFALMMAGVVYCRRDAETHKRLAVLAAIALFADPAIGRIPSLAPLLLLLLFLPRLLQFISEKHLERVKRGPAALCPDAEAFQNLLGQYP